MSGLQFHKLDLHVHTPASNCFLNKSQTAEGIIQAAIDKGLDGIAITDHNSAEWIDKIKDAAQSTSLVVFPGVEVSTSEGFHVVALFNPDKNQKHVESFLSLVDIKPESYGQMETFSTENIWSIIEKIHSRDGLAILSHIDTPKGAFFELVKPKDGNKVNVPVNCSRLFNEANYDAIEIVDGKYPNGFDQVHGFTRFPAIIQTSDNPDPNNLSRHSAAGIGARFTYFNIETINLEGVRLCFADPEVRIRLQNCYTTINHPKIVNIKVGSGGFLQDLSIDFHEGLNSLIGGKGVGKSLIVEFIRFGLCQPPGDAALWDDHNKKVGKRLGINNYVEITYQQKDGTDYKVHRDLFNIRKDNSLITNEHCINLETGEEYEGDIPTIFPILAYSQTEVIKIAEDKNAQLQLIDRFIDPQPYEQEINTINDGLLTNDQLLKNSIEARDIAGSIKKSIDTLVVRIKAINKSLKNPLFEKMKQAESKKTTLDARYQYLVDLVQNARDWLDDNKKLKVQAVDKTQEEDQLIIKVQKISEAALPSLQKKLSSAIVDLEKSQKEIGDLIMSWMPTYDEIEKEYQEVLESIGGDLKSLERERKRLEGEKAEYEKTLKDLYDKSKKLDSILSERKELLDKLDRAYYKYYDVRKTKYSELTALTENKIKLELAHAADTTEFENLLVEFLKGGTGSLPVSDRRRIAQNLSPRRFIQLVYDRNALHLANEGDLTESWAEKVIEKLWSADDFSQVLAIQHSCYPADVPSISFRKDEKVYGELDELSVGQKCTALLIIALCDGSMPIIIDQPEDALDIASVWEDVAKKLRRGKESRQFILTTHNSSVAVGSDSDKFIVLQAGADSGKVIYTGAIDQMDVRQSVIDHLEGGNEPYNLRARKYNLRKQ